VKNLILLIFMLFGQVLPGQEIPFPDTNTVWYTTHIGACHGGCEVEYHWKEYLAGDTLVGDKTYSIVMFKSLCTYMTESVYGPPHLTISNIPPVMLGGIREDSGRVFFNKFHTAPGGGDYESIMPFLPLNEEILLYNFQWEVGDTHYLTVHDFIPISYVVRSRQQTYGRNSIYLEGLNGVGYYGIVIEGLGEMKGLFGMYYSLASANDYPVDVCMIQHDTIEVGNGYCYTCDSPTSIHYPNVGNLGIYPNPAVDEFRIVSGGPGGFLQIFSATGQRLYSDPSFEENTVVSASEWGARGIYTVVLTDIYGSSRIGRLAIMAD
jgi:hypothetical protein